MRETAYPPLPEILNVGSGKDWREDTLNIDISDHWTPDCIVNLNEPFPKGSTQVFETSRFGPITISSNQFERIIARDVLEHLQDLMTAMTSCLNLLKPGGVFDILVPYDLSYGAWQDPTHVRAFNERSWLYYTDWFWYMGWSEYRFQLDSLEFQASPIGQELIQAGNDQKLVLRTPRAIDAMEVCLRKVELSGQDRTTFDNFVRTGIRE